MRESNMVGSGVIRMSQRRRHDFLIQFEICMAESHKGGCRQKQGKAGDDDAMVG